MTQLVALPCSNSSNLRKHAKSKALVHRQPLSVTIGINEQLILDGSHHNSMTGNRILTKASLYLCILGIRFRNPIDLLICLLFAFVTWILESEVPDYFCFSVDWHS